MAYAFDPELAPIIDLIPASDLGDVVEARAFIAELLSGFEVDTTGLDIVDHSVPGPDGAPDVTVRTYRQSRLQGVAPAVLYLHGGGFVVGSIDTEHAGAAGLAQALPVTVASVEYRLAPENPYPAGIEDCYAALRWLHDGADELGSTHRGSPYRGARRVVVSPRGWRCWPGTAAGRRCASSTSGSRSSMTGWRRRACRRSTTRRCGIGRTR